MTQAIKHPTITLRIKPELLATVTALATEQDRSIGYIIRNLITVGLASKKEPVDKQKGIK